MIGIVLEDYDSKINDYFYEAGQKIKVVDLDKSKDSYAIYRYETLDWIPKRLVRII